MAFWEDDDRRLIDRMKRGDRAAFEAIYERHAGRVLAFACQLTGNRADAEDLTQDAFLALFDGKTAFRGQSRLYTYLIAIAVRRYRDKNRRPPSLALPDETETPPTSADSPVENAVVASIAFRQALATLDEPLREAFLLVMLHGLTQKETAEILETPLGTIKWRVTAATKRLRAALSDTTVFEREREGEKPHENVALLKIL